MMMSFCRITRLLLFVLVSAGVDVSSGSPIVVSCDCPVNYWQLESMYYRSKDILDVVETLNEPVTYMECRVYLASYGFDDSIREAYIKTSAVTSDVILVGRGVTVAELDFATCKTRNLQTFDTWESPVFETAQLLETLNSAAGGTIIVGVSVDSAETGNLAFQSLVGPYFTRYNMNLTGLAERDKLAFIMQKGYPKKSIIARQPRFGENLRMKIVFSGSSIYDATFYRV